MRLHLGVTEGERQRKMTCNMFLFSHTQMSAWSFHCWTQTHCKFNTEDWKTERNVSKAFWDVYMYFSQHWGGAECIHALLNKTLACTIGETPRKPKSLRPKLPSSRNNLLCCWQNVEWHIVLSAGLPLASRAHGANTQCAPPPHLSVSVPESHFVIRLLFPPPWFFTLSFFIYLPCLVISPYISTITACFTVSSSQLSHSLIPHSTLCYSQLLCFFFVIFHFYSHKGLLPLQRCPSNYPYSALCVCAMIWL